MTIIPRCSCRLALALVALAPLGVGAALAQTSGGLNRLDAWPEEKRNLAASPSFEEMLLSAPSDWTLVTDRWSVTDLRRRSGSRSLWVKDAHLASRTPQAMQILNLVPGWYNVRGYARTDRVGSNRAGSGARIVLSRKDGTDATRTLGGTTATWTELSRTNVLVEAAGPAQLRLEAHQRPNGSIYFDDVAVRRQVPPFVEGFLIYPNYRGVLFADRSQSIRMSVTAHPSTLGRREGDFLVSLVLQTASGGVVSRVQRTIRADRPTSIAVDASKAPPGRLRLRLLALDASTRAPFFEYAPHTIVKSAASVRGRMAAYVDPDRALVVDGRRRFPLGIYDSSGRSTVPAYYARRLRKIAQAPFDLYLNPSLAKASVAEVSALTAALRPLGMSYLQSTSAWYEANADWPSGMACGGDSAGALGQDRFTRCMAGKLRSLPGFSGWYTGFAEPADRIAPIFSQYRLLKGTDPDGVTFLAQDRPRELSRWRDVADVIGLDLHPIDNVPLGTPARFEKVLDSVDLAQDAMRASRPVWAVIQFHRLGSKGHWPTYAELRTMSYMAIVGGAKGLLFRTYGAGGLASVTDPDLKEEYWGRLVKLAKEIRELEPVLLAPDASNVLASAPDRARIRVMTKRLGNTRYVFAVNRTGARVRASFLLSQSAARADVLDEGRSLKVSGRAFADTFAPYGVHVYQIPAGGGATTTTVRTTTTTIRPTTSTTTSVRSTTTSVRTTTTSVRTTTTSVRTTTTTASSGTADLRVRQSGPASARAGDTVVYTITVDNLGPASAGGILVSGAWSGTSQAIFMSFNDPRCAPMGPTRFGCSLGTLGKSGAVSFQLRLRPSRPGTLISGAVVNFPSPPSDPNSGNNSATAATTIN